MLTDLFPTEEEYARDAAAEAEWWISLKDHKEKIRIKEKELAEAKTKKDKKIAAAMAQMPKWIAEYKVNYSSKPVKIWGDKRPPIFEIALKSYFTSIPSDKGLVTANPMSKLVFKL